MIEPRFFILLPALVTLLSCGGSNISGSPQSPTPDVSSIFSDTMTIKAIGTDASSCTVTGERGRTLGSGSPSSVSYQVGAEKAAVMNCGSKKAVFGIGDDTVALSAASTLAAAKFVNTNLGPGSHLLASTLAQLYDQSGTASLSLSKGVSKSVAKATAQTVCGTSSTDPAADSLAEIATALDTLANPLDTSTLKTAIIKILVNSGEAVVIENVGSGQTLSACTDVAATSFSSGAKATDASAIGMTGCLVYHCLDATSDKNNPLGAPANNVPASFRTVMKETGALQQLVDSYTDNRYFSLTEVNDYLYTQIGYSGYTEDEEGATTTTPITVTNMTDGLTPLISSVKTNDQLLAYRFHSGYNPSGGWEINAAAALQALPVECVDSDNATVCSVAPLKFDFDGTTLKQNASGDYILEMEYSNGSFLNKAYVINAITSLPYRDSLYRPAEPAITASLYSAIDYANPLYQSELNPMQEDSKNSAPFSNAEWQTKYPNMKTMVDNNYQFPTVEVAARQIAVINQNTNLSRLPAMQAYMITKLMIRGMAAFPKGSAYVLPTDHTKTLSAWETATASWLASGTPASKITSTGGQEIQNGALTINKPVCKNSSGTTVSCTITSTLVLSQGGSSVSGGTRFNVTSGNLVVASTPIGTITYTPTYLLVATDDKSAQLLGDLNLDYSFTGKDMSSKVTSGNKFSATYTMTAIGN